MKTTPGTSEPPASSPPRIASGGPPPPEWAHLLEEVLIPPERLQQRVDQLAKAINRDFARSELLLVPILTGTILFLADLLRRLTIPVQLDFVGVSSYRDRVRPGKLIFTKELRLEARGRDLLIIDDILDSGQTLARVRARLAQAKPQSVRACVLLAKESSRKASVSADYVGFVIPNKFVVGYGLDYAERYRNLPFVGVLRPERSQTGAPAAKQPQARVRSPSRRRVRPNASPS